MFTAGHKTDTGSRLKTQSKGFADRVALALRLQAFSDVGLVRKFDTAMPDGRRNVTAMINSNFAIP